VSFAAIALYVASQRAIPKVNVYFFIDLVRKLLDTPSYAVYRSDSRGYLLQVLLTENTGNMVVSGVILSILLAIVQQGAEGNTQAQLTKVLHAGPSETKKGYSRLARNLRVRSVGCDLYQ
jgi:hypothetical protein